MGKPFTFSRIQLHYPAPSQFRHYQHHCGCPIEFNTPASALWLPASTLDALLPLANQITQKQTIAICELEMKRVEQIQKGDIRWLVSHTLTNCQVLPESLDVFAEQLNLSPRTLRRRLQSAGTHYRQLYQQHQLQLALQNLADEHIKFDDIAKTCGFKDSASFRNAFIRWTNMTPSKYRRSFDHPYSKKKTEPDQEIKHYGNL
jgi:AraC-like DNA-binding protein